MVGVLARIMVPDIKKGIVWFFFSFVIKDFLTFNRRSSRHVVEAPMLALPYLKLLSSSKEMPVIINDYR